MVPPIEQLRAGRATTPGGELIAAHERLRASLEALAEDQILIADLMRRVDELGREVDPDNVAQVSAELESLAAILESHFSWEERRLDQLEPEPDRHRADSAAGQSAQLVPAATVPGRRPPQLGEHEAEGERGEHPPR